MKLSPLHLSVAQLLEGRMFRIPDYQRGYSWESKHRSALFHDIEEAYRSKSEHFMATIVALAREKKSIMADEFSAAEIVDGQQRITTIIILLKAIEKSLIENKQSEIRRRINRLIVKEDDFSLLLLQTNHDSSNIFKEYMRTGSINKSIVTTSSDQNIVDAATECEAFVCRWGKTFESSKDPIIDLLSTIWNKLSVIYHEVSDEAMVYRVFEVLNSRGLDVRWMDKTKSQLMSLVYEHSEDGSRSEALHDLRKTWQSIYATLGLDAKLDEEALRFAGTLLLASPPKRILSQEDAHQTLCEFDDPKISAIIERAAHLLEVVKLVKKLNDDPRRSGVTKIRHARFLAIAIMMCGFAKTEEDLLLRLWEKVTFRVFGLGRADARHEIGRYVQLAHDAYVKRISTSEIMSRLREIGGDKYSIDQLLKKPDIWENCYEGWADELRYLLFRYEESIAKKKINEHQWLKVWQLNAVDSIEHIIPQSRKVDFVHNIGNLTIIPCGLNSSLKDADPIQKASDYKTAGLHDANNIGCIIENNVNNGKLGWSENDILNRIDMIANFVRDEFGE